jgi:hypothetical protein
MFCLKTAFRNIKRHRYKSILVVLTTALIVYFAFVYMDSIAANQAELDNLPGAIPVSAKILNLNGSQEVGLVIDENRITKIKNSGTVKDLYYSARISANFTSLADEKNVFKQISIMGVNDIQAVPGLDQRKIELADSVGLDFLHGSDALCLADDMFMQKNKLSVGDTVELALYSIVYDSGPVFTFKSLGTASLRIVGEMTTLAYMNTAPMDIVCPINWAKERFIKAGADYYLDSANFTVLDPLNLDTFKAAMKDSFMLPVNPLADMSVWGNALSVRDETFIATAGRLKNSLAVLYTFAPVIFFVIALVGYALSYLLMQSRRADIAIMRSLGTSRAACVAAMFIEYAVLGLAGSLLGMALSAALTGFALTGTSLLSLLFFVSFMLGIAAAAFQISRWNTMSGRIKTEA